MLTTTFTPHKTVITTAAALMMLLMAMNVNCAWDFFVWNGLADEIQVEDEQPSVPGSFTSFTRDQDGLTTFDELVYVTPTPREEKNADCFVGIPLLTPEYKFRDAPADGNEGYVAYVYKAGFFGANDNLGTGTPLMTWPSQCILS